MKKQPVFFTLTIGNDILWRYALLCSIEPAALIIPSIPDYAIHNSTDVYIEVIEDGTYFRYLLKYRISEEHTSEKIHIFDIIDKEILDQRNLIAEHREIIRFKYIQESELGMHISNASIFNRAEWNSTMRVSSLISSMDIENRPLVRFMLELNNKMDVLLHHFGKNVELFDIEAECRGVNTDSYIFYTKDLIKDNTLAYTENIMGNLDNKFRFASVVRMKKLKAAQDGAFYSATFIELSDTAKDQLIRFIFTRERELINDLKFYKENEGY